MKEAIHRQQLMKEAIHRQQQQPNALKAVGLLDTQSSIH
jgi:hypothetical protein